VHRTTIVLVCAVVVWSQCVARGGQATSSGDANGLTQRIPRRSPRAPTGSRVADALAGLDAADRERAILREILDGNMPSFLRQLAPVELSYRAADRTVAATIFVTPDYLAIGSDDDFLRIPMNLATATTVADAFGFVLPTRKMVNAIYEQSGFTYELRPSSFDPDGWRLEHDPRGAFIGADFASAPARTEQFLAMHQELSTSPTSGFVRIADVMRRTDEGVDVLRGCVRMTTTGAGTESVDVDSEADWWGVVIDEFGLRYGDLPAAERARVWGMVRSAHEAWDAAGRS